MTESNLGKVDKSSVVKLKMLADLDAGKLSPADPSLTSWRFNQVGHGLTHDLDVADKNLDTGSFAFTSKIDNEWSKLADLAGVDKDQIAETLENNNYDYLGLIGSLVFPN